MFIPFFVYADNCNTNVTNSTSIFLDCTSLVGGSGTVYDSSHVDATYAHIDEGTSNPGYFTKAPESIGVNVFNGVNSLLNSINKEY